MDRQNGERLWRIVALSAWALSAGLGGLALKYHNQASGQQELVRSLEQTADQQRRMIARMSGRISELTDSLDRLSMRLSDVAEATEKTANVLSAAAQSAPAEPSEARENDKARDQQIRRPSAWADQHDQYAFDYWQLPPQQPGATRPSGESKEVGGETPTRTHTLLADFNRDGIVDWQDFRIFAGYWGTEGDVPANLKRTGKVDWDDFLIFASEWMKTEPWYRFVAQSKPSDS